MPLAASCNATSKLRDVSDLARVRGLGFRGQGLWALEGAAEVLVVRSRVRDGEGVEAVFEDGKVRLGRCAMAPGTSVEARGLRWEFGKKEMKDVRRWLENVGMVWSGVRFCLRCEGKVVWRSFGVRGDVEGIARMVGREAGDFVAGEVEHGGIRVVASAGIPGRVSCADGRRVVVAVNGRCVRMPEVERCVKLFFRSALPPRRFPVCFVRVTAREDGICDWNLSPMKETMRMKGVDLPLLVEEALGKALALHSREGVAVWNDELGGKEATSPVVELLLQARSKDVGLDAALSDEIQRPVNVEGMISFVAIAQTLGTYIVAEHNGCGIYLIEQHTADERILFEELRKSWSTSFVPLPPSRILRLPTYIALDDERLLALSCLGFKVAVDDDTSASQRVASLRSVPSVLSSLAMEALLPIICELSACGMDGKDVEDAAAEVACRLAIKNGEFLSQARMDRIVAGLARCENPHTCPHGRPVFLEIGRQDLASIFKRRYVPQRRPVSRRRRFSGSL